MPIDVVFHCRSNLVYYYCYYYFLTRHPLACCSLEDPDDTLKRKTLDLLYRMTNPVNVAVIVDKLASHLKASTDPFLRSDLVARITAAAEQFAPSNSWYLTTMTSVFELGGDLVRPEVAQNLIRLVAEGTGESEEGDAALRAEAVATYSALLERHIPDPATAAAAAAEAASSSENGAASSSNTSSVNAAFTPLPDVLVQVLTWVLGEYAHLPTNCLTVADTAARLAVLAQRPGLDVSTRGYALDAVIKLTSSQMQVGAMTSLPPACAALLAAFTSSRHVELSQRCREWSALLARSASGLPRVVLPIDASTEDITVDEELPFLAGFVANALSAGAKPYSPPQSEYAGGGGDGDGSGDGGGSGLRFDEYKREEPPSLLTASAADVGGAAYDVSGGALGGGAGGLGGFGAPGGAPGLLGGQGASRGVWGKEGYRTAQGVLGANAPPAVQPAGGMIPAVPSAPDVTSASNQFAGPIPPLSGASGSSRRPWDALPLNSPQQPGGAPAAAAPEPPKPRELTEKEKQAALLFGGILPGAPAPAPAAAAAARRPTPAAAPAPVAAAPAPVAAAPRPAPAPAPAAAVDDLLGIFGAPAPAPAPAAAAFGGASAGGGFGVSGGGFSGGGGDMFGGLNSAMGGLSLSSSSQPTSAAAAPSAGPPLDVTSLPVPPALVPLISAPGARREPASGPPAGVKIAEAGPLAVAAHRVLAPEALHVVLTVAHTGLTSAPLPGVNVTLNPHPFLAVAGLRSSVGGPAGPSTVSLGSLAPRSSGTVVATLALSALPSGGPSAPLSGSLAVPGQPPIPFSVDIPVTDVLRPAPMDTPSFGGLWTNPAMTSESVANVAGSSIRSPADLMARVGTAMNAHPVQMIAASECACCNCKIGNVLISTMAACAFVSYPSFSRISTAYPSSHPSLHMVLFPLPLPPIPCPRCSLGGHRLLPADGPALATGPLPAAAHAREPRGAGGTRESRRAAPGGGRGGGGAGAAQITWTPGRTTVEVGAGIERFCC